MRWVNLAGLACELACGMSSLLVGGAAATGDSGLGKRAAFGTGGCKQARTDGGLARNYATAYLCLPVRVELANFERDHRARS